MLWWLFRWLFWQPQYRYDIAIGTSHASAEEAAASAKIHAGTLGGEWVALAADALCCAPTEEAPQGGVEWDVYILVRG